MDFVPAYKTDIALCKEKLASFIADIETSENLLDIWIPIIQKIDDDLINYIPNSKDNDSAFANYNLIK